MKKLKGRLLLCFGMCLLSLGLTACDRGTSTLPSEDPDAHVSSLSQAYVSVLPDVHHPGKKEVVTFRRVPLIKQLTKQGVVFAQQGEHTAFFLPASVLFDGPTSRFKKPEAIAPILAPLIAVISSYQTECVSVIPQLSQHRHHSHQAQWLQMQRAQRVMDALWPLSKTHLMVSRNAHHHRNHRLIAPSASGLIIAFTFRHQA